MPWNNLIVYGHSTQTNFKEGCTHPSSKLINYRVADDPKAWHEQDILLDEFGHPLSFRNSLDTQMNFRECWLGHHLPVGGQYNIWQRRVYTPFSWWEQPWSLVDLSSILVPRICAYVSISVSECSDWTWRLTVFQRQCLPSHEYVKICVLGSVKFTTRHA